MKTIVRARGGSRERVVEVKDIVVPDLWKIVHNHDIQLTPRQKAAILECWYVARDMLEHIKNTP